MQTHTHTEKLLGGTINKLLSILDNQDHPLHHTLGRQWSVFSKRLKQLCFREPSYKGPSYCTTLPPSPSSATESIQDTSYGLHNASVVYSNPAYTCHCTFSPSFSTSGQVYFCLQLVILMFYMGL